MAKARLKSRRSPDQGLKWVRIAMGVLATIGIIDTGSITINKWGWIEPLTCPGGSNGCDQVLNSPWGLINIGNNLSIPLSLIGFLSYSSIFLMAIIPLLPSLSENKSNLSRRTWWGLFVISTAMAVFSLLLIFIMIGKIKAFCFFCILSALISILLLIFTIIGGDWDDPGDLLFKGTLITLVVILGGLIWSSSVDPIQAKKTVVNSLGVPPIVKSKSTPEKIALAKELTAKGAVMYNAYWCPHCHDQKEMFGKEAVEELNLIECAKDGNNNKRELCEEKGITGYPSWEINGKIESGIKSLEELAEMVNF